MVARRLLLLSPVLLALPARAAPADLTFRVMRQGAQVGTHTVRFRDDGDLLRARSELRIQVRLAGFTVYRYLHETEEAWRGDRLVGLESRADQNGRPTQSQATAEAGGLRLRGTAGETLLPPQAAPLTWWRFPVLVAGVPLFDARDGRLLPGRLERRAEAGGRVRLVAPEGTEALYDAAGTWIGFATKGEDGSVATYERA